MATLDQVLAALVLQVSKGTSDIVSPGGNSVPVMVKRGTPPEAVLAAAARGDLIAIGISDRKVGRPLTEWAPRRLCDVVTPTSLRSTFDASGSTSLKKALLAAGVSGTVLVGADGAILLSTNPDGSVSEMEGPTDANAPSADDLQGADGSTLLGADGSILQGSSYNSVVIAPVVTPPASQASLLEGADGAILEGADGDELESSPGSTATADVLQGADGADLEGTDGALLTSGSAASLDPLLGLDGAGLEGNDGSQLEGLSNPSPASLDPLQGQDAADLEGKDNAILEGTGASLDGVKAPARHKAKADAPATAESILEGQDDAVLEAANSDGSISELEGASVADPATPADDDPLLGEDGAALLGQDGAALEGAGNAPPTGADILEGADGKILQGSDGADLEGASAAENDSANGNLLTGADGAVLQAVNADGSVSDLEGSAETVIGGVKLALLAPVSAGDAVSLYSLEHGGVVVVAGAGDTIATLASALAAQVNAHAQLSKVLSANSAGGVVSIALLGNEPLFLHSQTGNAGFRVTELYRMQRQIQLSIWTCSDDMRSAVGAIVEALLAKIAICWGVFYMGLPLANGEAARLLPGYDFDLDDAILSNSYRRDFLFGVEFSVTSQDAIYSVLMPGFTLKPDH